MKPSTYLLAAASVLTLGLAASGSAGGVTESRTPNAGVVSHSWAYRADTVDQMAREVHAVAVARFVKAEPGRVVQLNDQNSVSFQLNHFVVEQTLKGLPKGSALVVERTSEVQSGQKVALADDDGGPFRAGQRYLLFLRKQSSAEAYYQVNDEARYAVGSDGRLETSARGKVAATLRGRSVAEASSALLRALRAR